MTIALAAAVLAGGCLSTPRWSGQGGDGGYGDGGVLRDGGSCGGNRDYVQVAAGGQHSCGVDAQGQVWCWGANDSGQLGDGQTRDRDQPVKALLPAGVAAEKIAAGLDHTCAAGGGGHVWCWGGNGDGQLGGSKDSSATPVAVMTSSGTRLADVVDIAAGHKLTCAVDSEKRVWCWGDNDHDAAGAQNSDSVRVPTQIKGIPNEGALGAAVGNDFACAWTSSGSVYCWGKDDHGELGSNASGDTPTAIAVPGVSGVVDMSAADAHACAVTGGGAVKCWGDGGDGQFGTGSSSSATPVTVPKLSRAAHIATGAGHSCASTKSGGLWCWGTNTAGEVGAGQVGSSHPVPPTQIKTGAFVTAVSAGDLHTCVVTGGGGLACFGSNRSGQIGTGDPLNRTSPAKVDLGGIRPTAVSAGGDHTCITDGGKVLCFGANDRGQLGDGSKGIATAPVQVLDVTGVTELAAGGAYSCAFGIASGDSAASLLCWGRNDHNQLGDDSGHTQTTPVKVNLTTGQTKAVATADAHTVALVAGQVFEWGDGVSGVQQVSGSQTASLVLAAAGDQFGCAAATDGHGAFCWGDGSDGKLGNGDTSDSPGAMVAVHLGFNGFVDDVAAGSEHACAIAHAFGTTHRLYCWGKNDSGQLGDGSTSASATPREVDASLPIPVTAVDAGGATTCAIDSKHDLYCWGSNNSGQLGIGSTADADKPSKVTGISGGVIQVSVGAEHTCALDMTNTLWCWGSDRDGQLGSRRKLDFTSPTALSGSCL